MNRKKKKPFYKKWWIWVIAIILFGGFVNGVVDPYDEEEQAQKEKDKQEEREKQEQNEKEDKEEQEESEEKIIEINKEIEFDMGNLTIELENVYVEDDTLSFGYWWNYWSSYDKAHFLLFAYPVVKQGGEELEEVDEKDSLLKQTKKGVNSRVDLEYELIDDSPVEIIFKTATDNPEEETIEVDIE